MPRSFLVKKYYRRNDCDVVQSKQDNLRKDERNLCYPSEYLEYATTLLALSKFRQWQWDYEMEKSYWFDTTTQESCCIDEEKIICDEGEEHIKVTDVLDECSTLEVIEGSPQIDYNCIEKEVLQQISLTADIVPADCDSSRETELSFSTEVGIGYDELVLPIDSDPHEKIDEKLNQFMSEDTEVATKNIRRFLENNRITFEEISIETGLVKEEIRNFMELRGMFTNESKLKLYRWYLTKMTRPLQKIAEDSYTCYKCGKIFTYKSYLERHIKYVCPDSTGRIWKCSYCGKAFQYPCYLRRHIRSHTGESPYKCDKCDRAFVRSTDLQRHIRNHTGEKPYSCSQCSRTFARSTDLKRHMRTHTGEKPYKCWQCGKSFSQSGSLQTHLHTHNKETSPRSGKKKGN